MPANNRKQSSEEQELSGRPGLALHSETLRAAADCGKKPDAPRDEEKISVFWRVFGGTLLSIAALVVLTVYQQFSGSLSDLRASVNHVNELQAEAIKKDELNLRTTAIWSSLKDLGNDVPTLKTQAAIMQSQLQAAEQERKELAAQVQQLRERVALMEGHHITGSAAKVSCKDKGTRH